MTITARNIGRINIWPTYDIAREADTEESKFVGQLTVWRTSDEARANISHEEGGGGGEPEWVPADAVIHIDLVGGDPQGRAWVQGTGEVAVDTLLGSDPNTENFWGLTEYDPENLGEHGYSSSNTIALIGSALTKYLGGATAVIKSRSLNGNFRDVAFGAGSADGNDAVYAYSESPNNKINAISYGGPLANEIPDIWNRADGAINVLAVTNTVSRFDVAVNGSDAVAGVVSETDRPPGNPFVAAIVNGDTDGAFQSITLYDALPSTTGLSALSETGITNTAPHDLVFTIDDTVVTTEDETDTNVAAFGWAKVIAAQDDEGSPLTYTVVDDEGGLFAIDANTLCNAAPITAGVYHPVVRATDPGGLYVEQEFTITVTA